MFVLSNSSLYTSACQTLSVLTAVHVKYLSSELQERDREREREIARKREGGKQSSNSDGIKGPLSSGDRDKEATPESAS